MPAAMLPALTRRSSRGSTHRSRTERAAAVRSPLTMRVSLVPPGPNSTKRVPSERVTSVHAFVGHGQRHGLGLGFLDLVEKPFVYWHVVNRIQEVLPALR